MRLGFLTTQMPADVFRLFVFARHAESLANAANMLNSNPSQPVALTARGRTQARALGAQLANLRVDLAVGTRLLRTQLVALERYDLPACGSVSLRPARRPARRGQPGCIDIVCAVPV